MTFLQFYVNIKIVYKERGEFLEFFSKNEYMEKLKEKNDIFSSIKDLFKKLTEPDNIEELDDAKLNFADIEKSRNKIKKLEEEFFSQPTSHTKKSNLIPKAEISKETLDKMREKIDEGKKLEKEEGKEIGD